MLKNNSDDCPRMTYSVISFPPPKVVIITSEKTNNIKLLIFLLPQKKIKIVTIKKLNNEVLLCDRINAINPKEAIAKAQTASL